MDIIGELTSAYDSIVNALQSAEPIWPQLLLLITALLVPAIYNKSKRGKLAAGFALVMVTIAGFVTAYQMYYGNFGVYLDLFSFDAFSSLMILLFLSVLFLVILISPAYSNTTKHHGEYYSLLAVATAGMMFVASATDLISIFLGVEVASISCYALVALKKNDPRAPEAAVKYLIIGGISTGLTLYGMSLVYGVTGTTQLAELAAHFTSTGFSWVYAVAFITMLAGYGFKVAAVPFHMWAPDVYEGAATPVSSFLATGSKKMGFVVFLKIFLLIFIGTMATPVQEVQWFFAIIAAITMTIGNIVAISQTNIKRMLAYSSIAQAGYLLIFMAVASEFAVASGLYYMIVHVFMKGGAFIVVAALITAGLGESISDYKGLCKRTPLVAFAMLIFMLSLAGIPPLSGFWAKFFLFGSALYPTGGEVEMTWVWLVFVAVINSAISLFYYTKVVKAMIVDKPAVKTKLKMAKTHSAALIICVVAVIALGIFPQYVLEWCQTAAETLFSFI